MQLGQGMQLITLHHSFLFTQLHHISFSLLAKKKENTFIAHVQLAL